MIIKENISYFLLLAVLMISSVNTSAEDHKNHHMRGQISARVSSYTKDKSRNYGQRSRVQIEHTIQLTSNLEAMNQLRWSNNTIVNDLSTKSTPSKKDNFDTYLGENYLKYKSDSWVTQIGYQEVIWGEAFGFNYADIIGPKDQRETLYSDSADARLPLLLFNGKIFFSKDELTGSIQFLLSPEPRYSKTLPVEIYAQNLFPQTSLNVIKEKTPDLFKTTEIGGKISASYAGLDMSLFTYSYLSRDPHYALVVATPSNITIKEEHSKVQSFGLSLAKTIYDFVFRTDIVLTEDKMTNYVSNTGQLMSFPTSMLNTLISLDTPAYNDYSGVLIFARSSLHQIMPNSFRNKNEQYLIGKLSKNLESDKSLEFSYTQELEHNGQSVQTILTWPLNSSTDLKVGGELYFGNDKSNLNKLKNVSSVFFSLKNYFHL